jgi:hypothetical protein
MNNDTYIVDLLFPSKYSSAWAIPNKASKNKKEDKITAFQSYNFRHGYKS